MVPELVRVPLGGAMVVFGAGCSWAWGKVAHGLVWRKHGAPEATPRWCVPLLCRAREGSPSCKGCSVARKVEDQKMKAFAAFHGSLSFSVNKNGKALAKHH